MIGIYIHWPFCAKKCPYCDFNSHVVRKIDQEIWRDHYMKDLDNYRHEYEGKKIETIFFGGGTPSLMSPKIVEDIVNRLGSASCEITLEVNPSSAEITNLQAFRDAGINRLSIGVQSFRDDSLKFLGRLHSSQEAMKIIEIASDLFDNFSFDLIYGLHGDTLSKWQEDLNLAMSFNPKHISLYQLMIEENTQFKRLFDQGKLKVLDSDTAADLYEYTNDFMSRKGIHQYEVSNYAIKGFESHHNLKYWRYEEYLGYGPGAHSRIHQGGLIYAREMEQMPLQWLRNRNAQTRLLSDKEAFEEAMMMGLRLKSGVSKDTVERLNQDWNALAYKARNAGLLVQNNSIIVPDLIMLDTYLLNILD